MHLVLEGFQEDAEESFGLFQPLDYDHKMAIAAGVDLR